LLRGIIFDASVDAIVSSEQTDFVLSGNPESLSGQIWKLYGDAAQRELDVATKGQVLAPGTVIETSGGRHSNAYSMPDFMIPMTGPVRLSNH
jgi:hypothetical protein